VIVNILSGFFETRIYVSPFNRKWLAILLRRFHFEGKCIEILFFDIVILFIGDINT